MIISEEVIEKVKEQNDIVDVISQTVRLKKSGSNYFGLCPFHSEKTPSFSVSPSKQIYKCFGCGEAGNVITFVMKTRNLDFVEAVKFLAERANIEIEYKNANNKEKNNIITRLYKLNVEAARFFFANLQTQSFAKKYFLNRGITEKTIRKFGLGYSLNKWDGLLKYLKQKGYSELEMMSVGLIVKGKNNSFYDRFRNRVIFPVFDYRGRVIGFGGRVLDDSKPKYLNSPETKLFHKGTNLYGLNFALKYNKSRTFIMVEGYMDCIALHQYGIFNTVASLGTALTVNQAKLLKRYADKIVISYDADLAGKNAALRGINILKNEGFDVRVLTIPSGKDPDEFVRANGKGEFEKLVDCALPFIDYRLKRAKEGIDFKNSEMLLKYAVKAAQIVADLNPVEKDIYIKKISEDTGISEQAIYDLLRGERQKNVNKLQDMNTIGNFGQKLYLEPAYIKAERHLLKLMLMDDGAFKLITSKISENDLIVESHKVIFKLIVESNGYDSKEKIKYIETKCCNSTELSKEWVNINLIEFSEDKYGISKFVEDYIKDIERFRLEMAKKEIMNKIKDYEAKGMIDKSLDLAEKLVEMQKKLGTF